MGIHFLFFAVVMTAVVSTPRREWLSNGLAGTILSVAAVWMDGLPASLATGETTSPFATFAVALVFVLAGALAEVMISEKIEANAKLKALMSLNNCRHTA